MKKKDPRKYLFIVQKAFMAKSIQEALKLEKKYKPTDVFVDSDWKKNNL